MFADFPPNSKVNLLMLLLVEFFIISRPTSVDPVKATLSIPGWLTIALPAVSPYPDNMLTTPSGNPASVINSPTLNADNGVYSAVFITIVHPVAKAGPNFHAYINNGKFQGIIYPTTPTGSSL